MKPGRNNGLAIVPANQASWEDLAGPFKTVKRQARHASVNGSRSLIDCGSRSIPMNGRSGFGRRPNVTIRSQTPRVEWLLI